MCTDLQQLQGSDNAVQREVEGGGRLVLPSSVQRDDLALAVDDGRAAAAPLCARRRLQVDCRSA